jgi:hypothetical protein
MTTRKSDSDIIPMLEDLTTGELSQLTGVVSADRFQAARRSETFIWQSSRLLRLRLYYVLRDPITADLLAQDPNRRLPNITTTVLLNRLGAELLD